MRIVRNFWLGGNKGAATRHVNQIRDFYELTENDLCGSNFFSSGWQRVPVLEKTEKHIDLDLFSPVIRKKAFVQIKSSSSANEFKNYINIFSGYEQYEEMHFVVHTTADELTNIADDGLMLI